VLVVLDNAQQDSEVQRLIPANGDCVVLVTSRMPLQGLAGAALIELAEMAQDDALQLLEAIVGDRVRSEAEAAREIVASCSGLPLALAVVAGRQACGRRFGGAGRGACRASRARSCGRCVDGGFGAVPCSRCRRGHRERAAPASRVDRAVA
jgi:NB-ARC domain-containing protein